MCRSAGFFFALLPIDDCSPIQFSYKWGDSQSPLPCFTLLLINGCYSPNIIFRKYPKSSPVSAYMIPKNSARVVRSRLWQGPFNPSPTAWVRLWWSRDEKRLCYLFTILFVCLFYFVCLLSFLRRSPAPPLPFFLAPPAPLRKNNYQRRGKNKNHFST